MTEGAPQPRAYTAEECQEKLMQHLAHTARYWADLPGDYTARYRCNGLVHSMLALFGGSTLVLPAVDLALCPHEEDKDFHISYGENWFEPGMVINNEALHELWSRYEYP